MRNFTIEDFSGAGQYLIKQKESYRDALYMSTIMYKVGWIRPNGKLLVDCPESGNIYTLISMSDGMTLCGYFDTRGFGDNPVTSEKIAKWEWVQFNGIQSLVDWLNNPELSQEHRFATQEEVVRVVLSQKSRWR